MNFRLALLGASLVAFGCGDDAAPMGGDASGTGTDGSGTATDDGPSTLDESAGACDAPFELECPPDETLECEGGLTSVNVELPTAACDGWSVGGDTPASLPYGEHDLEFTMSGDGMMTSCTTTISVVDTQPPTITCPESSIVLRTDPSMEVVAPEANAEDVCWDTVDVTANPAVLPSGMTSVEYTATDGAGNEASCNADLEVVDAFAVEGFRLISGTLTAGGDTEITLAWEPNPASPVSGYRIETAQDEEGPWTEVGSVGGSEQLFGYTLTEQSAWFRVVTETDIGDGGITAPRAAYMVTDELYDIRDVPIAGIPFDTTLYGVVRYPTALGEGPYPLIVVLHGNHGNCRNPANPDEDFCSETIDHECSSGGGITAPNAEGYTYFLDTLAAQGYVTVSISGNAMNCRADYILERSRLIIEHLSRWSDWNGGSGALGGLFSGAVDLDRVGLVGHSRGGDAVSNVPGILAGSPLPGVNVRSVFAVAPTDFHGVQVRNTDLAVLLPSCDGDVSDLQGLRHYDRSVGFDDNVEQAQVFFIGANHNYFNTEWRLSEWELFGGVDPFCEPPSDPQKLVQTAMLEATLGSWFGSTLAGEPTEAFVRGEVPSPSSFDAWAQDELELRWSYSSPDRVTIDDFTGAGTPGTNDLGGANSFTGFFEWEICAGSSCTVAYPHLRNTLRILWEQDDMALARLELAGYDATDAGYLSFRVVSRRSTFNTGLLEQDFLIRVSDTSGQAAEFPLSEIKTLNHLYPSSFAQLEILETVRIPIERLLDFQPMLDVSSLEALEFEAPLLDRNGTVNVTDLEFAQ